MTVLNNLVLSTHLHAQVAQQRSSASLNTVLLFPVTFNFTLNLTLINPAVIH